MLSPSLPVTVLLWLHQLLCTLMTMLPVFLFWSADSSVSLVNMHHPHLQALNEVGAAYSVQLDRWSVAVVPPVSCFRMWCPQ